MKQAFGLLNIVLSLDPFDENALIRKSHILAELNEEKSCLEHIEMLSNIANNKKSNSIINVIN